MHQILTHAHMECEDSFAPARAATDRTDANPKIQPAGEQRTFGCSENTQGVRAKIRIFCVCSAQYAETCKMCDPVNVGS